MSYSTKFASNFYGPFRTPRIPLRSSAIAAIINSMCEIAVMRLPSSMSLRRRRRRPLMVKPGLTSLGFDSADSRTDRAASGRVSGERRIRRNVVAGGAGLNQVRRGSAGNLACLQARRRAVHHYLWCALCEAVGNRKMRDRNRSRQRILRGRTEYDL